MPCSLQAGPFAVSVQAMNTFSGLVSHNTTLSPVLALGGPPQPTLAQPLALTLTGTTITATLPVYVDATGGTAVSYYYSVGLSSGDTSIVAETCTSLATEAPSASPGSTFSLTIVAPGLVPRALHYVTIRVVDGLGQQVTLQAPVVYVVEAPLVATSVTPQCALQVLPSLPADAAAACGAALGVASNTSHVALVDGQSLGLLACWSRSQSGLVDNVTPEPLALELQVQVGAAGGGWTPVTPWLSVPSDAAVAAVGVPAPAQPLVPGMYQLVLRGTNTGHLSSEVACPAQVALGTCYAALCRLVAHHLPCACQPPTIVRSK